MSEDLSSFFQLIAEEKKKQQEEINSLIGEDFFDENFLNNLVESTKPKAKKQKPDINDDEDDIPDPDNDPIVEDKEDYSYVENYVSALKILDKKEKLEETLTNPSSKEIQELKNLVWQLMRDVHLHGGGGEVRLEFLDDVARDSAKRDNYFLKYDATINKWVGDEAGGVGITSVVFITGVTTYYSATRDVDYIGINADVPVTIDLPTNPYTGKQIIVKDEGNKISTYNVTVRAGIGASVENDSSVIMKINHESFTYFYNGYNWYIV